MNPTMKYEKYEAEYAQYLMGKYFSDKSLCGGKIFDNEVKIDDQIIKSSRFPCMQSYINPVQAFSSEESKGISSFTNSAYGSSSFRTSNLQDENKPSSSFLPALSSTSIPCRKPRSRVQSLSGRS
ncbi:hypothetical protein JCGZ_25606 [Jatropha curcas]|uniref:Uncharacterized protein n=1 Tax=Jatropha curcas TaxID=180498 RepID=A0A067JWD9_JATCU|nr:hypothetical protein JCGZ_25606 [Jatropha curcas]